MTDQVAAPRATSPTAPDEPRRGREARFGATRDRDRARGGAYLTRRPSLVAGSRSPFVLLAVAAWVMVAISATRPLYDVDSYWHVLVGNDILNGSRFSGDPGWTFGPANAWVTTQWASEVLMAGLHAAFGWGGLAVLALVCGALTLLTLARAATVTAFDLGLPGVPPSVWVVVSVIGFAIAGDLQERPASISYVFLAVLAVLAHTALRTGVWRRWWVMGAFTCLWAQFHGYWVLVAVCVAVVFVLRAATYRRFAGWVHVVWLGAVTSAAGVLSPAGLYGLVAPVRFKEAAGPFIEEWGPSSIQQASFVALLAVAAFTLAALTAPTGHLTDSTAPSPADSPAGAQTETPGTSEGGVSPASGDYRYRVTAACWVALWVTFGCLAFRNVTPALILIAPVAIRAAATTAPTWATRARATSLTSTVAILALIGGGALATTRVVTGPSLPTWTPYAAYEHLNGLAPDPGAPGTPVRVLNYYDVGGQTLALTGSHVQVAIDGRADRYGSDVLSDYADLMSLRPGWEITLDAYDPDYVLTQNTSPLLVALRDRGWEPVTSEATYSLWAPPATRQP